MEDRHDENEEFSPRFLSPERLIERAFASEELRERAARVAIKAMGDVPPVCPQCGDLCPEHVVRLRDSFLGRAKLLTMRLLQGLDLYQQSRLFGVHEPVETINAIYQIWSELALLHDLVEPQLAESDEVAVDEGETPDE
jgi:hypothetical protein